MCGFMGVVYESVNCASLIVEHLSARLLFLQCSQVVFNLYIGHTLIDHFRIRKKV